MKDAVLINNRRWKIKSNLEEFKRRAKYGILIGALDSKEKLLGTVSGVQLKKESIDKIGTKKHWANTWKGITGDGSLSTNNPQGDSLVCVSVTTKPTKPKNRPLTPNTKKRLSTTDLQRYLESNLDTTITFHKKAKGGQNQGAKIVKVIESGRPEDKEALGYNVLMQYPTPKKLSKISKSSTIGGQLIEAALYYSYQKKISYIYVYTRPSGLSRFFIK